MVLEMKRKVMMIGGRNKFHFTRDISTLQQFKKLFPVHFQCSQSILDDKLWYRINVSLKSDGAIQISTRPDLMATGYAYLFATRFGKKAPVFFNGDV